jgi:hypothetical protein
MKLSKQDLKAFILLQNSGHHWTLIVFPNPQLDWIFAIRLQQ